MITRLYNPMELFPSRSDIGSSTVNPTPLLVPFVNDKKQ